MSALTAPEQMVKDVSTLISLPDVVIRLNSMVEDDQSTATDIGNVIVQDPSLTAQILRIANSPLYRGRSNIDSVATATTALGTNRIRDLALDACMGKVMEGIPNPLISSDTFWSHSLFCGLIAKALAQNCMRAQSDALFTCGLLHDIGQLVLFHKAPESATEAIAYVAMESTDLDVAAAERRVIGIDHTQVGAALAKNWGLPPIIATAIEHHHTPAHATDHQQAAYVVHLANSLAVLAELESSDLSEAPTIDPGAWEATGLDEDIIEPTLEEVQEQYAEARHIFKV